MLTPIDIQNHVLKSTMGGYNKKETDDFIASVQESYEELYKENHDLKEKVTALSEGLQYYKQMESTLQKALVLAEKTSTETLDAAKTQASTTLQEAQEQAETTLQSAQEQADAMLQEATEQSNSMVQDASAKSEMMVQNATSQTDSILVDSRREAAETLTNAKETADALLQRAKQSADNMIVEANDDLKTTIVSVQKLKENYNNYIEQYKTLVSNQLALLNDPNFQVNAPGLDNMIQTQLSRAEANDIAINERKEQEIPTTQSLGISFEIPDVAASEDTYVADDNGVTTEEMANADEFVISGADNVVTEEQFSIGDEIDRTPEYETETAATVDAENMTAGPSMNTSPFTFIDAN